jgi:hypothetical protein
VALVNAYASVAEVRDQFNDGGSLLNEALLERAINAASRAVDKHCHRRFWRDASVTQRTYLVEDCQSVFVNDISTRTGLVVATGTDGTTFPTTLASTDFVLEPRNADVVAGGDTADAHAFWRIVMLNSTLPVDYVRPTMRVTARFGWSAVPEEVKQATIIKAAALFKRKDAPFGVAGFGEFGTVRITRSDPDVLDLLSAYELPGFA